MYKLAPNCVFTIWPNNLGSPAIGPFYEYRLVYDSSVAKWRFYVDSVYKAEISTGWASANRVVVGSELAPINNATIEMGPTNFQDLQYRTTSGAWVYFYFQDWLHCDSIPLGYPYNLIHPVGSPTWIYTWGPAQGGYCG